MYESHIMDVPKAIKRLYHYRSEPVIIDQFRQIKFAFIKKYLLGRFEECQNSENIKKFELLIFLMELIIV